MSVWLNEGSRRQYIYMFSGHFYCIFDHNRVAFGDWREIERDWGLGNGPVDAAFNWEKEGKTYIVIGC